MKQQPDLIAERLKICCRFATLVVHARLFVRATLLFSGSVCEFGFVNAIYTGRGTVCPFWSALCKELSAMHRDELYKNLIAQASLVKPGMNAAEIAGLSNPHIRAFAILISDICVRSPSFQLLVGTVRVPEAGSLGNRAWDEVKEALREQTPRRIAALQKRKQALLNEMGPFFPYSLAHSALQLLDAGADVVAETTPFAPARS